MKDLKKYLIKDLKKGPYQGSKKYLINEPYQGSKKSTLSRNLIKNLKIVPYQRTLSTI